ncbi:hypothetical protein, partial [Thermovenabulum sp.]|uniref:hypothetical protein n=1 Tax=Thermovenabulum sp. TaxID=3100335 RepID=UPI003C7997D2
MVEIIISQFLIGGFYFRYLPMRSLNSVEAVDIITFLAKIINTKLAKMLYFCDNVILKFLSENVT